MTGSFGKLGFGVPYFKGSYLFWRWWTWLVMNGFEPGDVFLNDEAVPGEVPIPMSHNLLMRQFLKTDCDTLCIIEDDHVADDDVVRRMRNKPENQAFDVVCASYTNRRGPPVPMGWHFTGLVDIRGWQLKRNLGEVALSGTQEYDGAGLGLVLIRRWVVEAMLGEEDPDWYSWFEWVGKNSQDIAFYRKAQDVGARVGVDRDNWIGHVGQCVYDKEDFVEWRERAVVTDGSEG
jgi:hypothetical protein